MKRNFASAVLLTALILILSACSSPSGPKTYTIGKGDADKSFDLRPGDRLVVNLAGNITTGYNWEAQPAPDENVLKQVGEPEFKADSSAVGSGGQITLTFEAVSAGQAQLNLVYHRPWEKDVAPIESYQVNVTVKQ